MAVAHQLGFRTLKQATLQAPYIGGGCAQWCLFAAVGLALPACYHVAGLISAGAIMCFWLDSCCIPNASNTSPLPSLPVSTIQPTSSPCTRQCTRHACGPWSRMAAATAKRGCKPCMHSHHRHLHQPATSSSSSSSSSSSIVALKRDRRLSPLTLPHSPTVFLSHI